MEFTKEKGGGSMREYEIIRSNRRTLALEVRDGRVLVRSPQRLPRAQIDAFVQRHAAWIEKSLAKQQARREAHPEPDEAQRSEYICRAKTLLPERVAYYAKVMGLHPAGVTITAARTRFGSCSAKGRLCFSWRLMQYPPEAIDYVVVHELAHLVHLNHGSEFYALIERYMPDYKVRRKLLRE